MMRAGNGVFYWSYFTDCKVRVTHKNSPRSANDTLTFLKSFVSLEDLNPPSCTRAVGVLLRLQVFSFLSTTFVFMIWEKSELG